MSVPARGTSSLFSAMRSSFTSGNQFQPGQPMVQDQSSMQLDTASDDAISTADKLDVLDQVLSEVEAKAASAIVPAPASAPEAAVTSAAVEPAPVAVPAPEPEILLSESPAPQPVVQPAAQPVPQPVTQVSSKEALSTSTLEQPIAETGAGMQIIEQEVSPEMELPVEVQGFIEQVQDQQNQAPQEIVVADGSMQLQPLPSQMKSVIVLPITPEIEMKAKHKGQQWSVSWLVEWSKKLMKAFSGKIIYREQEKSAAAE